MADDLAEYDEVERRAILRSRANIPEEMRGLPVFGQIVRFRSMRPLHEGGVVRQGPAPKRRNAETISLV